jgi:exosortase
MSSAVEPPPRTAPAAPAETPAPRAKNLLARLSATDWIILGLLAALFGPMFRQMVDIWAEPEAPQAYALLILPAALGLAWMLRDRLQGLTPQPTAKGLIPVALGLFCLFIGTLVNALTLSALGFVIVVAGVVWARYGGAIARCLWFPIAYLLALVPFPSEMLNMMTFPLQEMSIRWASLLLRPFGDVRVEGTQLHLNDYSLNVIAPCSGLTIVLPIMALAVYYLYMIAAPFWKKAVLFALTFPVAMSVNAVRVALIALVGEAFGAHAADTFHDYSGLITVVLGFLALIFIAQEMRCNRIHDEIAL